jgi:hypothetical protein
MSWAEAVAGSATAASATRVATITEVLRIIIQLPKKKLAGEADEREFSAGRGFDHHPRNLVIVSLLGGELVGRPFVGS